MNTIHIGVVKFFNVGRLYGFITDNKSGRDYFCHNSGLIDHIKRGDNVTFELIEGPKGAEAQNVKLLKDNNLLIIRCDGECSKKE